MLTNACYISDLRRFEADYPKWRIRVPPEEILLQFVTQSVRSSRPEKS
jgi:hypothetical protein